MRQSTTILTKTKTSKSKLTIEQICPEWSRILPLIPKTDQQQFYRKDKILDISDAKYCVVGEAYGFKGDYFDFQNDEFCQECFNHSVNFASALISNQSERRQQVNYFVSHWNDSHV